MYPFPKTCPASKQRSLSISRSDSLYSLRRHSLRDCRFFFLLKDSTGTSLAAFVMILVMLPCFLLAMYEKHGQPLETLIKNIIQTKFIRPKERPYQTENFYAVLERQRQLEKEVSAIVNGKHKTRRKQA